MSEEHGADAARQRVRDALAELQRDQSWLAREAGLDAGTLGDFLAGHRWPRLPTLAKIEHALGWTPGTIDRINRGGDAAVPAQPAKADEPGLRAMLHAVERELAGATQAWAEATMRLQEAQIAARAAEDRRAQLVLDHARLTQQLERLQTEGGGHP